MSDSESDSEDDWENMKTVIPPGDTDDTMKSENPDNTMKWLPNASSGKSGKSGKSGEESDDYGYNYNQPGPDLTKRIEGPDDKPDPETEALEANEKEDITKAPDLKGANQLTERDLYRSDKSKQFLLQRAQEEEDAQKKQKEAQKKEPKDENVMLRFY